MDIWPHLELNYKTELLLGGSHEYKFECIWSVIGIPINLEKDGKVLNFSIVWSFVLFPLITSKPCSEPQRASFASVNIQQTKPNISEIEPQMETSILSGSWHLICIRNIKQWAALIIYIWVPRVMKHITAAKNRKSLLTVTQFELAHCIVERIIR